MKPPPFYHPAFQGRMGVCRRELQPPPGIYARQWGAAASDVRDGVHRPLTLTAITFQDAAGEAPPLALVSVDFCVWRSPSIEGVVLLRAACRAGFAADRVILALTHTHSAVHFSPAAAEQQGGDLIAGFLGHVENLLVEALEQCQREAEPGLLEVHHGTCGLAANRDMRDPDGNGFLVGWNRESQADETLLVGRITRPDGTMAATVVNYACHPTILAWENTKISPDYPGAMREVVESETGAPSLFLQGASGELAPRHQYTGDTEVADRAGRCLGHAVLSTLYEMQNPGCELRFNGSVDSGAPLGWWKEYPREIFPRKIQIDNFSTSLSLKADLRTEEQIRSELVACEGGALRERLRRALVTRRELGHGRVYDSPHRLWRIGDVLFLSICTEVYSILQIELRRQAVPLPLMIATSTCGALGNYLPPRQLYSEKIYPVAITPYAEGGLENMIATTGARLARLLAGENAL